MFEFSFFWAFLALPWPFIVYYWMRPASILTESALRIPFYNDWVKLRQTTQSENKPKALYKFPLLWIIWLLLLSALAQPQWVGKPAQIASSGRDLMLAVDLSGSMQIKDMKIDGQAVNRLAAIKQVVSDFIKQRQGDRLGLILFGTEAYLQVPLTFDQVTMHTLLNEATIGIAGNKTAIGDAIGLAIKHLQYRPEKSRVLILLTDGTNTAGVISPLQAAKLAAQAHIKIYTIGMGADTMTQPSIWGLALGTQTVNPSSDLDEELLKQIATITGGHYFRAKNTKELHYIYQLLNKIEPVKQKPTSLLPVKSLYPWPLGGALIISFLMACYTLLSKKSKMKRSSIV